MSGTSEWTNFSNSRPKNWYNIIFTNSLEIQIHKVLNCFRVYCLAAKKIKSVQPNDEKQFILNKYLVFNIISFPVNELYPTILYLLYRSNIIQLTFKIKIHRKMSQWAMGLLIRSRGLKISWDKNFSSLDVDNKCWKAVIKQRK